MMVSGIPTASGYEERIRFSEMEVVDRGANEQGLLVNMPDGHAINGWDVNVAAVRTTSVKRTVRYHQHAVSNNTVQLQEEINRLLIDNQGIYSPRSSRWETRYLRGQAIWGICQIAQAITRRAARQDAPASPQKE